MNYENIEIIVSKFWLLCLEKKAFWAQKRILFAKKWCSIGVDVDNMLYLHLETVEDIF